MLCGVQTDRQTSTAAAAAVDGALERRRERVTKPGPAFSPLDETHTLDPAHTLV